MKKNILLILLSMGYLVSCNDPKGSVENDSMTDATQDTAVVYDDERGRVEADGAEIKDVGADFWANIDWEAPVVDDPELKNSGVELRSTNEYNIYSMDERVLFDTDKAQVRSQGEEKLQKIADELKQLPENRLIRIYGHADARASKDYNEKLSADRANTVKDWLQNKGGISANRISIEAMGETAPRATNETAKGRQMNRRVAVVAVTRE